MVYLFYALEFVSNIHFGYIQKKRYKPNVYDIMKTNSAKIIFVYVNGDYIRVYIR